MKAKQQYGELDTMIPATQKEPMQIMKHRGNNLTSMEVPYVHYQCGCSRQFIDMEMYICFKCEKVCCKFCVCQDEIETFYCRFCLDTSSKNEAE